MDDHRASDPWLRHKEEQRAAWRRLSYAERLRWLEQAKRFCWEALGAARRRRQEPSG